MVQKALDEGLMDFHKQKDKNTGRQLYEIERQKALINSGEKIHEETRRFDDKSAFNLVPDCI